MCVFNTSKKFQVMKRRQGGLGGTEEKYNGEACSFISVIYGC